MLQPTPSHRQNSFRPARLVLEDGAIFRGRAFGAQGVTRTGEIVFNTAMSGYQESLTDPSYSGQILVQTFPLVGIVGVNSEDEESAKVHAAALVVRELVNAHSNFRAEGDLDAYLARHGVPGIEGVDTRALTRRIREHGAMRAVISDDASISDDDLLALARQSPTMEGQNLASLVSCAAAEKWSQDLGAWGPPEHEAAADNEPPLRVLAIDCGAKRNILRHLRERGCEVDLLPVDVDPREIRRRFEAGEADGLFISNGPGDPAAVQQLIAALRDVLAESAPPTFGICLGHQLLALALGAKTFKLRFGHHGANQPVLDRTAGRVEITSQNHGFAVDPDSLAAIGAEATHIHLNDGTLAGFRMTDRPVFAVQYHPEASPGPHDAAALFDRFVALMREARAKRTATV